MRRRLRILACQGLIGSGLAACAPPASEGGFDSPLPAAKLYAIETAARENDRSSLKHIVEQLDSDDPAVRMLAIAALERMTGETFGYRHYDPPQLRADAIERWVHAIETNQFAAGAVNDE